MIDNILKLIPELLPPMDMELSSDFPKATRASILAAGLGARAVLDGEGDGVCYTPNSKQRHEAQRLFNQARCLYKKMGFAKRSHYPFSRAEKPYSSPWVMDLCLILHGLSCVLSHIEARRDLMLKKNPSRQVEIIMHSAIAVQCDLDLHLLGRELEFLQPIHEEFVQASCAFGLVHGFDGLKAREEFLGMEKEELRNIYRKCGFVNIEEVAVACMPSLAEVADHCPGLSIQQKTEHTLVVGTNLIVDGQAILIKVTRGEWADRPALVMDAELFTLSPSASPAFAQELTWMLAPNDLQEFGIALQCENGKCVAHFKGPWPDNISCIADMITPQDFEKQLGLVLDTRDWTRGQSNVA